MRGAKLEGDGRQGRDRVIVGSTRGMRCCLAGSAGRTCSTPSSQCSRMGTAEAAVQAHIFTTRGSAFANTISSMSSVTRKNIQLVNMSCGKNVWVRSVVGQRAGGG